MQFKALKLLQCKANRKVFNLDFREVRVRADLQFSEFVPDIWCTITEHCFSMFSSDSMD